MNDFLFIERSNNASFFTQDVIFFNRSPLEKVTKTTHKDMIEHQIQQVLQRDKFPVIVTLCTLTDTYIALVTLANNGQNNGLFPNDDKVISREKAMSFFPTAPQ